MFTRSRLVTLLFGLALVCFWAGVAAADADAAKIDTLIEQLGSVSFQEREAATKALDAIGVPALEKLRKATQSDDIEIKRRATDLVQRIEKRTALSRLLAPKRVHLAFKDTPLKEAVEDFKKKSGYDIALHDPENKLEDRKVTLETGDVTFWEAFDQFCDKAGLVQITPQELMQQRMQEMMKGMRNKAAPPLPRVRQEAPQDKKDGAAVPPPAAKDAPKGKVADDPAPPPAPKEIPAAKDKGAANPPPQGNVVVVPAQAQPVPAPPRAIGRPAVMMGPAMGGFGGMAPDQILLVDGKPKPRPTHYAGSVRVRGLDPPPGQGGADTPITVHLEVATEPRMQMRYVAATRITKAVDDNGQVLTQEMPGEDNNEEVVIAPGGAARALIVRGGPRMMGPYGMGGPGHIIVSLKKGEKPSQSLKELSGTITVQAFDSPEALITVDNILKAGGTTTKGKSGGLIKVVEATKTDEGRIKLQVEVEQPPDVMPARGPGIAGGGMMATPAIRLNLAVPAQAPPPPAPAGQPKDKPNEAKGEDKKQAKAKQEAPPPLPVAAPALAPAQVAVAFDGGINSGGTTFQGLSLVDDKGKSLPLTNVGISSRVVAGGQVTTIYELTSEVKKGQGEPAKLIFSGSKPVTFEVSFTLKDVPLK